jgi:hypothetical protein
MAILRRPPKGAPSTSSGGDWWVGSLGCKPQVGEARKISKPRRAGRSPEGTLRCGLSALRGCGKGGRRPGPGVDTPGWTNFALWAGPGRRLRDVSKRVFGESAPQGRRHRAWGFNPRNRAAPIIASPEGAQAAETGQSACAPLGLLEKRRTPTWG